MGAEAFPTSDYDEFFQEDTPEGSVAGSAAQWSVNEEAFRSKVRTGEEVHTVEESVAQWGQCDGLCFF